ncbi:MAG: outer rane biosis protein BamB, partial [Phycisphaerales bacterium]|nr:outer rane biosis protein BamB [Phycisphaerales bacterium]
MISFGIPLRMLIGGVVLATSALAFAAPSSAPQFRDPGPPVVNELITSPAPEAQKNADTTFHAAPKPLAKEAAIEDWPCFLGARHNGFSGETRLLGKFPPGGPALVWEMAKGEGYAEPAVAGERLILFHRSADNEIVDCLKASTGERYWRYVYPTAYRDRYGYCNGPRSSPAVSGESVYTYGAEGKLHCIDLKT